MTNIKNYMIKSPAISNIRNVEKNLRDAYCAYVPLEKINFSKWSDEKLNIVLLQLKKQKKIRPILIGSDADEMPVKLNKYGIIDGNHRCESCKILGYTHIPAIVPNYIDDESFVVIIDRHWHKKSTKIDFEKYSKNGTLKIFWKEYFDECENEDRFDVMSDKILDFIETKKDLTPEMMEWLETYNEGYLKLETCMRKKFNKIKKSLKN